MKVIYESLSDKGLKRPNNQDRVMANISSDISLFAVADGMGGHSDGEYASQSVIDELEMLWNRLSDFSGDFQSMVDEVISSLEGVNKQIFEYASEKNIICGSTVSILLICGEMFAVINVGDSPVYYADRKDFVHASTEHSYGVIMQKTTLIDPEDIDKDRKDRLVQAIGVKKAIYPSVRTGAIRRKTVFLLCSDGISRYFTEKQIKRRIKSVSENVLSELAADFKKKVYEKGAADNLSLVIVCADNGGTIGYNRKIIPVFAAIAVVLAIWIIVNIIIWNTK